MIESLKNLYESNDDFKHFVDKHIHSKDRMITIEEAFEHEIVKLYAEFLHEKIKEDEKSGISSNKKMIYCICKVSP